MGITHARDFARPVTVEPATATSGHGGGDAVLFADSHCALSIDRKEPARISELIGTAPIGER